MKRMLRVCKKRMEEAKTILGASLTLSSNFDCDNHSATDCLLSFFTYTVIL